MEMGREARNPPLRKSTLDQWLDAEIPEDELDRLKEQMKEPSDLLDRGEQDEEE